MRLPNTRGRFATFLGPSCHSQLASLLGSSKRTVHSVFKHVSVASPRLLITEADTQLFLCESAKSQANRHQFCPIIPKVRGALENQSEMSGLTVPVA